MEIEDIFAINLPPKKLKDYLVVEGDLTKQSICIYGFPFDEGTKINNGRVGSENGPNEFRKALFDCQFSDSDCLSKINFMDAGNVSLGEKIPFTLEATHDVLTKNVENLLQIPNCVPFIIGGSNDQSYPNALALLNHYSNERIGVINIDAHFDVRPLVNGSPHSGSPFRLLLENELFPKNKGVFVEFACQGAQCSNAHYNYLKYKKSNVYFLEKDIRSEIIPENSERTQAAIVFQRILNNEFEKCQKIFISFDVDSINSAFMPGVSAPSVIGGLTDIEAIQICEIAGNDPRVALFDMSEMNPSVEKIRSPLLMAHMFYAFAKSLSTRKF